MKNGPFSITYVLSHKTHCPSSLSVAQLSRLIDLEELFKRKTVHEIISVVSIQGPVEENFMYEEARRSNWSNRARKCKRERDRKKV